jgi:hypothetical protein
MKTLSRKDFGSTPPPPPDRQANCSAALHFTKGNPLCGKGTGVKCASRTAGFEITVATPARAIGAIIARG